MPLLPSLNYYRRIASAYLLGGQSHLTFWHETPEENLNASASELGEYYMLFAEKANYRGAYDSTGIPQLDYRGKIGRQHNPIAIAQYGLGNYNLFRRSGSAESRNKFLQIADWLVQHLEKNPQGLAVWNHHFDWEYRDTLRAPWYSALAQGQGISVLEQGDLWFEEYIVSPPTHILNGFIWAAWGVYDYFLATRDQSAQELFARAVSTLTRNLDRYDLGFWSLYEQSGTRLPMVASPFYHQLHIVQLRVMHRLTGEEKFRRVADRWESYGHSRSKRTRALCYKSAFKLCYY
jgi:heparosan-N-sulfate-glucuronate 5-epimerase